MRRTHSKPGFSLVEVIVVTLILAILGAIVYAMLAPSRERAFQDACSARLKQLYAAMQMYGADNEGGITGRLMGLAPPPQLSSLKPYLESKEMFYCPETPDYVKQYMGSSYLWRICTALRPRDHDGDAFYRELNERGPATVILDCRIHDEVYYYPREQDVDPRLLGPYLLRLRLDGSVARGRAEREPRTYYFTRRDKGRIQ
ncbi:MAG: hypothetical protein AKCLJLPJ_00187 [Fimbriimonadales bacterium]|nr:hypothetical protein [Fimbriimonadales bacterium]